MRSLRPKNEVHICQYKRNNIGISWQLSEDSFPRYPYQSMGFPGFNSTNRRNNLGKERNAHQHPSRHTSIPPALYLPSEPEAHVHQIMSERRYYWCAINVCYIAKPEDAEVLFTVTGFSVYLGMVPTVFYKACQSDYPGDYIGITTSEATYCCSPAISSSALLWNIE